MKNILPDQLALGGQVKRAKKGIHKDETSRQGYTFLELPDNVLLQISEYVGLNDLPNLFLTCRAVCKLARRMYDERRVMDMRCFPVVTPRLCRELIERFSKAKLHKCYFKCSVTSFRSKEQYLRHNTWVYDKLLLDAIMERFLDNWDPTYEWLVRDLRNATIVDVAWWNGRNGIPRPIDVLAHCYCLDQLLATQTGLKELELDVEFSIFKFPRSKGHRHYWQLLTPFVALNAIRNSCPELEVYVAEEIRWEDISLQQTWLRFFQHCRKLKSFGTAFRLEGKDLEMFDGLARPLALEEACFFMTKWQVPHEQRMVNYERLRALAKKLVKLKDVVITFKARGCLSDLKDFLHSLPVVESLSFCCQFNPGVPDHDIDEGVEVGRYFCDLFLLVPKTVKEVTMMAVPEQEFELVLHRFGPLPFWIHVLWIQFRWESLAVTDKQIEMLDKFVRSASHLEAYRIEALLGEEYLFLRMHGFKCTNASPQEKFTHDAGPVFPPLR